MPIRVVLLFGAAGVAFGTAAAWAVEAHRHHGPGVWLLVDLAAGGLLVLGASACRQAMVAWGPPYRIRRR